MENLEFLKVNSSRCCKYNYEVIFANEAKIKSVLGLEALENKKLIRKQFRFMCERINEEYASKQMSKASAENLKEVFAMFGFCSKASVKDKLSEKVCKAIFG